MRSITVYPQQDTCTYSGQSYFIDFVPPRLFFSFAFTFLLAQCSYCFPFCWGQQIFSDGRNTWALAQACASWAHLHQRPSPACGTSARTYSRRPNDSRSARQRIYCRSSRAQYKRSDYLPRQQGLPLPPSLQLRRRARVLRPPISPILTVPNP